MRHASTRPDAMAVRASTRLYRLLLAAYPAAFRHDYGAEMARVFRDSCRDAHRQGGVLSLLWLWPSTLVDLAAAAFAEHRSAEHAGHKQREVIMSRGVLVRVGGAALVVASVASALLLAVQVAILLDFARSYTIPFGRSVVESPWIGRGEVAVSLGGPTVLLLLLVGMVGLHALAGRRAGRLGRVALTLVVVGLVGVVIAGSMSSALAWGDLSRCVNPRDCNIYDATGMFRLAAAGTRLGMLIAAVGLVLYGVFALRTRVLARGNVLPLLLGLLLVVPYIISAVVFSLTPDPGAEGDIKLSAVFAAISLIEAILWAVLGRALLRAPLEEAPAIAGAAS